MERLTERFDNGQAAVMGCGENCKYDYKYCRNHYEDCPEINRLYERLAEYEDTGLTPEQIRELKESVQRLDKIFGDEITVDQVIDFFVDFYIAQRDPDRVEAAELLTNEEVARYRELKERDTAKEPQYEGDGYSEDEIVYDTWICPNCGTKYEVDYDDYKFCPNCGQRLKWED